MEIITKIKKLPLFVKIIVLAAFIGLGYFIYTKIKATANAKPIYSTEAATRGTLIQSIDGSGTITSGNYTTIQTKVSGIVSAVYVTNGDTVTKGQKIADVTLDDYAKERQAAAWNSYTDTLNAVKASEEAKVSADLAMWKARQDILDAEKDIKYMNENPINPSTNETYTVGEKTIINKTLEEAKLAFTTAESQYNNSGANIANAYAKVSSMLRAYQENSGTIVAPADGIISDLALAPSLVVSASSTTSNTSGATIVSPVTIGKISNPTGQLIGTVTFSEIDIIKVKANQKVTLTLDAYPDKTFTGKVLAVNTSGNVSSGVTSYPVTILIDTTTIDIYPNMAINAKIMIAIKDDVVLVPSAAVTTANGESTVRILVKNEMQQQPVQIGLSNDTETEIVTGINAGDTVITSVTSGAKTTTTTSTQSVFSSFGGGGGAAIRGAAGGR